MLRLLHVRPSDVYTVKLFFPPTGERTGSSLALHSTGMAFWSRGHGLAFSSRTGGAIAQASRNFPMLRFLPHIQDDFASLIQACVQPYKPIASDD